MTLTAYLPHPTHPFLRRPTALASLLLLLLVLAPATRAEIYWPKCDYPAEGRAGLDSGDFYDLCIRDHVFSDVSWSWKMTKATVQDVTFERCEFRNVKLAPNNFTGAYWKNVMFEGCTFGSYDRYNPEIIFDKMSMEDVTFKDCVFDHSIRLVFREFAATNVLFDNCVFRNGALFTLGEMTSVEFRNCRSRRMDEVEITNDWDSDAQSFTLRLVTANGLRMRGSDFVNPLKLEGLNAEFFELNKTTVNAMTCAGPQTDPETNEVTTIRSSFNDSVLTEVVFDDVVDCPETTWRRPYFVNVTFHDDADFSRSTFIDAVVDGVDVSSPYYGDCPKLNFSRSEFTRKLVANVSAKCIADFEEVQFSQVRFHNFYADEANFKNALFSDQEYIDGQCCSSACKPLQCLCNVTFPSGTCPAGDRSVNISKNAAAPRGSGGVCFPGDATLTLADGSRVSMADAKRHDAVAIGNGRVSRVWFFGHRDPVATTAFVRLTHQHGTLHLSPGHYLYANGRLTTARAVRVGDALTTATGQRSTVTQIEYDIVKSGLFAPASLHGDLIVDDILVSSYTDALHPDTAHRLLAPFRWLYQAGVDWPVRTLLSAFEHRSYEHVARRLGLTSGPAFRDS